MKENLNLVEILKDCPKGTKLYSPAYGDVELWEVYRCGEYPITIKLSDNRADSLTKDGRVVDFGQSECMLFPSREQRDWSKFKVKQPKQPKFDPKTLQPFDKVLARDIGTVDDIWKCTFYSHKRGGKETIHKYATTDGAYICCIPYNDDTKHLLGTSKEAPEFYRYWEE